MVMDLELRHLRCLVAIVDSGTFTDAAIELGISQAAVSRNLMAPRQAPGVRLLHRTSRTIIPDPGHGQGARLRPGQQVLASSRQPGRRSDHRPYQAPYRSRMVGHGTILSALTLAPGWRRRGMATRSVTAQKASATAMTGH